MISKENYAERKQKVTWYAVKTVDENCDIMEIVKRTWKGNLKQQEN